MTLVTINIFILGVAIMLCGFIWGAHSRFRSHASAIVAGAGTLLVIVGFGRLLGGA